jgi:hypothetical protein
MLMTSNQTIPIKKNNELICSNVLGGQINSSSILTVSAYCLMILMDFNVLLFKWYAAPFPNSHKSSYMTECLTKNSVCLFVCLFVFLALQPIVVVFSQPSSRL